MQVEVLQMETAPARPIGSMFGRLVKELVEVVTAAAADGEFIFDMRAMLQIIGEEVDIIPEEATTTCSRDDLTFSGIEDLES